MQNPKTQRAKKPPKNRKQSKMNENKIKTNEKKQRKQK